MNDRRSQQDQHVPNPTPEPTGLHRSTGATIPRLTRYRTVKYSLASSSSNRRTVMAIDFACACGQKYSVDESLAGKSGRCKKCGATMLIPQAAEEIEEAELVAPPKSASVP